MRFIKRLLKVVFWTIIGVFALAVIAVVGAKIYLDDERLAELVESNLNELFAGHFEVGEIKWSLPFHFIIDNVAIDDPEGQPVIRVSHVDARLRWRALLHGTLAIDDIAGHGIDVRVMAMAKDPNLLGIAEAFTPKSPALPEPDVEDDGPPITLDFHGSLIDRVEFVYDDNTTRVVVANGHIEDVAFGMKDNILDIHGNLDLARFAIKTDGFAYDGGPGRAHLEAFDIDIGDTLGFAATKARIAMDGVTVEASGDMHFPDGGLPTGTVLADANLPLDHALLKDILPVRGRGNVTVHAESDGTLLDVSVKGRDASLGGLAFDSLTAKGTLQGERLDLDRLQLNVEGGSATVTGELELEPPMQHDLTVDLDRFPLAEVVRVFAEADAPLPQRMNGRIKARGASLAELATHVDADLRADGLPSELVMVPDPLRLEVEADLAQTHANVTRLLAQGDGAALDAHGRIPFTPNGAIDAQLILTHKRPNTTLAKAGTDAPVIIESLTLTATASGTLSKLVADALLEAHNVTTADFGPATVRAPLHVEHGVVTLDQAAIGIGGGRVVVDGTVGVMDERGNALDAMPLAVKVSAQDVELGDVTDRAATGKLVVDGHFDGTVQAPRGELKIAVEEFAAQGIGFDKAQAVAVLTPTQVEVRELALDPKDGGDLSGHGRYVFASTQVDAELGVRDLPLAAVLALSAPDVPMTGVIAAQISVNGPVATPHIKGNVRVSDLASGDIAIGTLDADIGDAKIAGGKAQGIQLTATLRGPLGNANVEAAFEPATSKLDAKVGITDVGLANALKAAKTDLPLDGSFVANADIHGILPYPAVKADLKVSNLVIDGATPETNTLTIAITTDEPEERYDARVDFGKILVAKTRFWPKRGPAAEIDATFNDFKASAFSTKLAKAGYELNLTGNTHVRYSAPQSITGNLTLEKLSASVDHHTVQLAQPSTISFDGPNVSVPKLTLEGAGSQVTLSGALRGGTIYAELVGDLDLAILGPFVTAVSEPTGVLHVVAKATGKVDAPKLSGEVTIGKEVHCRPRGIPQELVVTSGRIALEGDSIEVTELKGRLETGTFEVRGRIGLKEWQPDSYDMRVIGSKLAFQNRELRVQADADLKLTGRGVVPDVSGDIVVLTGRYYKKFALKDFNFVGREPDTSAPLSQTAPALADMDLDIHATSREDVEVSVDASAFAVSLPLQLDLRIRGTPLSPSIGGRISAQAGGIKFPEATLSVQETLVTFTPGLPPSEGANIQLVAEGEVPAKGEDSTADEVYLVSMTLSGTLATMQFDLSASPGLDRNQTLALLITGKAGFDQLFYGSGRTTGTASGRSTSPEVDAAIALAGAGVTGPLTGFVENQLEDRINLKVDLSASFTSDQVRVTARKELTPRLRLEGSVQRALQASGTNLNVATATFVLGNRWFLQAIAQAAQGNSVVTDNSVVRPRSDNRLEMRYRLIGD